MPGMREHEQDHRHNYTDRHAVHLKLVDRLRRQAAEVKRLTMGLDESALATPTVPGKWSLKELVCHIRRMEEIFGERLNRMLTEDNPPVVPYTPDGDAGFADITRQPTEGVLEDYLREREALCRRLESLPPADWHRKARHPEFEHYDVHFQTEYMAHHEAHHIYQLFQRRVPLGKLPH
jgi:DinB superfamily